MIVGSYVIKKTIKDLWRSSVQFYDCDKNFCQFRLHFGGHCTAIKNGKLLFEITSDDEVYVENEFKGIADTCFADISIPKRPPIKFISNNQDYVLKKKDYSKWEEKEYKLFLEDIKLANFIFTHGWFGMNKLEVEVCSKISEWAIFVVSVIIWKKLSESFYSF